MMNTIERATTRKWLNAEILRGLLHYSPENGEFTWLERAHDTFPDLQSAKTWNTRYAGKIAGSCKPSGYVGIRLVGRVWYAHRLAWLYMTGEWPLADIDHKDRVRNNNRWENLRIASPSQNQYNRIDQVPSSGYRGVTFHKQSGRWRARIKANGRCHSLGYFDSAEAAGAAYAAAVPAFHGGYAA